MAEIEVEKMSQTCRKCKGAMQPGKAIAQTLTGVPDFHGDIVAITLSPGGPGKMIDCMKCTACGWSVTGGQTSRAQDRDRLKELASVYGGKLRVNGVGQAVKDAWAEFAAAVDELVGDA